VEINLQIYHEKLRKFQFKDQLMYIFYIYVPLLIISGVISILFLYPITCCDKEFFPTILQIQATLFGIIFAVTIVLIELSIQNRSPRITELFKKWLEVYFVIFIFLFSIILNLYLLCKDFCGSLLYILAIILSIYTILIIIPYIWDILSILGPYNQLQLITTYILNAKISEYRIFSKTIIFEDLQMIIQLFSDIMNFSLEKGDLKTLNVACIQLNEILGSLIIRKDEKIVEEIISPEFIFWLSEFKNNENLKKFEFNPVIVAILKTIDKFSSEWPNSSKYIRKPCEGYYEAKNIDDNNKPL